jgi:hypothetical protein
VTTRALNLGISAHAAETAVSDHDDGRDRAESGHCISNQRLQNGYGRAIASKNKKSDSPQKTQRYMKEVSCRPPPLPFFVFLCVAAPSVFNLFLYF